MFAEVPILDVKVHALTMSEAVAQVIQWAKQQESCYVCAANVHMVMEASDSHTFRDVVNSADLVVPDGMPLVWASRWRGYLNVHRVRGPDLMLNVCKAAASQGIPVGFYGSSPKVIYHLVERMRACYKELKIVYAYSPPFRTLTPVEDQRVISEIKASGVRILFVGLGCPKQEYWMSAHRHQISAVMLGVGAAFDMHAGLVKQAPLWMQKAGLEWLFRFFQEPRRLWKRYIVYNPRFVKAFLVQWLSEKMIGKSK